jgi:alpha-beta hydrolase superfamily lysophospholipase
MTTVPTTDEPEKARAALLRSMSLTRMLDYGMDHWDAVALIGSPVRAPWDETAAGLAGAQLERAEAASARGDVETAVGCYRRATAALVFAQLAFNQDTAAKRGLYGRLSSAYESAARLDERLLVERLHVPFDGSVCNAWLVRPTDAAQSPTVVIVGGQSGWGPAYHRQARALAERGLSAVLLEAPGQGETRLTHGLYLDDRVGAAFTATFDAVERHTGHDHRFGVWGNSFGGLLAVHGALSDDRVGACCVNGAPARPEPAPFRTAREQSQALLGLESDDLVADAFRRLWIDPDVHHTDAAVLVLHGGRDPLISREQQEPFLRLSDDSTLRVWDDGEHTVYNHSTERNDVVGDWFRSRLGRG